MRTPWLFWSILLNTWSRRRHFQPGQQEISLLLHPPMELDQLRTWLGREATQHHHLGSGASCFMLMSESSSWLRSQSWISSPLPASFAQHQTWFGICSSVNPSSSRNIKENVEVRMIWWPPLLYLNKWTGDETERLETQRPWPSVSRSWRIRLHTRKRFNNNSQREILN